MDSFETKFQTRKRRGIFNRKNHGDGHLDKNFTLFFIGQEEEINALRDLISESYDLEREKFTIKYRKAYGVSFCLQVKDALLGRLLFCLGAPMGNKTKKPYLVPFWIFNFKQNSKLFLQGLLEDELSTVKIEKSSYSSKPRLKLAKDVKLIPNLRIFLRQIKFLIERLGVNCSGVSKRTSHKKNQETRELYLDINRNKENIINFSKNIGFRITQKKIKKLNECVGVLKRTKYNRKPFIDGKRIETLRKKGYSIRQISKILNLNKSSVHRVLLRN